MPQSYNQQTVNQLVKGLVTEAGELTFPENASVDESNCILNRDGSRQRRYGLEAIPGAGAGFAWSPDNYTYFLWKNAGGVAGLTLLALQSGSVVRFVDLGASPITDGLKGFSVDLTSFGSPSGVVQFAQVFSGLVVACEGVNTFLIKYNQATDTISTETINFVVRDFAWQDNYGFLDKPINTTQVTDKRKYDTYNAGWNGDLGTAALSDYVTARNAYPPLTHAWFSGKNSSGVFSLAEWEKIHAPTSIIANGSVKLNFFAKDRNVIPGLDLPIEYETSRFSAVASYAGRLWYAGLGVGQNSGKVLFCQTITDTSLANAARLLGQCHQINDPTSEDFSDLLDTDGGEILIPEAVNIKKLHTYGDALFVFAENGVWFIKGVEGRFTPTSYFVNKVTNTGIESVRSFVSVEGVPFWWSKAGIHTLFFDENSGFPSEQNISINVIQTFFNEIPELCRKACFADYDSFNQKIYWWFCRDEGEEKRNHALILDVTLKAFYPWSVSGNENNFVIGSFYFEDNTNLSFNDTVTVGGDDVTVGGNDVYITEVVNNTNADSKLICVYHSNSNTNFGQFTAKTFVDFESFPYTSFVEAGYFFAGDMTLKKNAPFVTVYCRTTEEGFTGNETTGYTAINPSSLIMKAYWDFKKTPSSSQQAYRVKPFALVNPIDLANNQQVGTVVTTRLKILGKGRSVRLRFESEEGKNFVFLGYAMVVAVNDRF